MPRVVTDQKNLWGAQGGYEAQRKDLWIVDFRDAVSLVSAQMDSRLSAVPPYFVRSVSLPELRVKADVFRRDSRPYNMPGWDDALDPVKMTFVVDSRSDKESSHIYRFLDSWRQLIRAGRGAMGEEPTIALNRDYRIEYGFNLTLILLKGGNLKTVDLDVARNSSLLVGTAIQSTLSSGLFNTVNLFNGQTVKRFPGESDLAFAARQRQQQQLEAAKANLQRQSDRLSSTGTTDLKKLIIANDLQYSGLYILENAWLGGFKMGDLDYSDAGNFHTIEATFYAENILDYALVNGLVESDIHSAF